MTDQEKIKIMQAYVDGAEIDYQRKCCSFWAPVEKPSWDWVENRYRIKPAEQTPAEAFLEKWKGKKICLSDWEKHEWFMPDRAGEKTAFGVCESGCNDSWLISYDWQEWQAPPRRLMTPEELCGKWIKNCNGGWHMMTYTLDVKVERYENGSQILGWADHPTGKLNESFYVEEER